MSIYARRRSQKWEQDWRDHDEEVRCPARNKECIKLKVKWRIAWIQWSEKAVAGRKNGMNKKTESRSRSEILLLYQSSNNDFELKRKLVVDPKYPGHLDLRTEGPACVSTDHKQQRNMRAVIWRLMNAESTRSTNQHPRNSICGSNIEYSPPSEIVLIHHKDQEQHDGCVCTMLDTRLTLR